MGEPSRAAADAEEDAGGQATRALFDRRREDPRAREQLIDQNRGLAEHLARRFAGRGEPVEDLVQVATIVGELKRHFRDKGWAVRVPRRMQEAALLVSRETSELYRELGRSPTVAE